jgi:hypothetical protein
LEQMKQASLQGVAVIVKPQFAGFERLPATALSPAGRSGS